MLSECTNANACVIIITNEKNKYLARVIIVLVLNLVTSV